MTDRHWDRLALGAIVVGAVIRALWVLVIHPPSGAIYSDMAGYVDRAVRVASAAAPARYDAFYPPGPHLFLALPMILVGTGKSGLWLGALFWAALSSVTPYALWRLCRLLLVPASAALAAAFASIYPLHIVYAGFFLSETPALAFLLLSLWATYALLRSAAPRPGRVAFAAGALGGLAFMCRPQILLNVVAAVAPAARAGAASLRRLAPLAAGFVLFLGAQTVYESVAAGRPTVSSENGGLTFFLGHCDVSTVTTDDGGTLNWVFGAPVAAQRGGGRGYVFHAHAVWEQDFYYGLAFACIREDGIAHLRLLARNVVDMGATTVPWPPSQEPGLREVVRVTNTLYTVALVPILFLAIRLVRRGRPQAAGVRTLLWQLAMALPVALVFFGDPRFRLVYDGFGLALLAAVVVDAWPSSPAPLALPAPRAPGDVTK